MSREPTPMTVLSLSKEGESMQKDWQEEQIHFAHCQDIIRENIRQYETEYEERHTQAQELYKAINSGDVDTFTKENSHRSSAQYVSSQLRNLRK